MACSRNVVLIVCSDDVAELASRSFTLFIASRYNPPVERVNKPMVKEFYDYSKLTSFKQPFDVTPICAHRRPSHLKNILT